jgi:hypothetical protein
MLQAGRSRIRFPMWSLDFSIVLILSATLWPWGRFILRQSSVPGIFLGAKWQPARKADNLIAICEPIVYKTWEPRCLTILRAFTAYYRDSFTFLLISTTCTKVLYSAWDRLLCRATWDMQQCFPSGGITIQCSRIYILCMSSGAMMTCFVVIYDRNNLTLGGEKEFSLPPTN